MTYSLAKSKICRLDLTKTQIENKGFFFIFYYEATRENSEIDN